MDSNSTRRLVEPGTALTVTQRASIALGSDKHEKKLVELASRYTAITVITNNAGFQECHAARIALKNERVQLEKEGKAARDDAAKFQKAVIEEQRRLIAIIEPEELRLQKLQDAWEAKVAAEKAAKEKAERDRVARIQAEIDRFTEFPISMLGKPSAVIAAAIDVCLDTPVGDNFDEFKERAEAAKEAALTRMRGLHVTALEREAEAARLKAEREELERLRAEQAQREREECARLEAEAKARAEEEAAARAKLEAELRAARERIEAEERQARLAREEADRRATAQREEADRIARERREAEEREARRKQAEEDAKLKAERDRIEAERREIVAMERKAREEKEEREREEKRLAVELLDGRSVLQSFIDRFGHRKEFAVIAKSVRVFLKSCEDTAA